MSGRLVRAPMWTRLWPLAALWLLIRLGDALERASGRLRRAGRRAHRAALAVHVERRRARVRRERRERRWREIDALAAERDDLD